jgi:hypothetical protein
MKTGILKRSEDKVNRLTRFRLVWLLLALSTAAVPSFGSQTKDKPPAPEACVLSPEDYAVYSALLLNRGKPEDPEERWDDKPDLIIAEATDSEENGNSNMWGFRSNSKQRPADDTVKNFNSRQKSSCQLTSQLDSAISYRLLSSAEHDKFFEKKGVAGWSDFYKKYPKSSGFWTFSPVGYNAQGSEALVYVGHHCGGLCGTGHLVLLAKENGRWVVKNRVMLWIS